MTDETSDSSTAVDTLEPEPPAVAPAATPAEPVSFWHRPNVERYVAPLLTPIIVVIGLVIYVLNLSRVFLSAHGHIAVAVGSFITVAILLGATVLANSARLRSQTMTLMTAGFVFVVLCSGWLVLGHSQVKGVSSQPLPAKGNVVGSFTINALASIHFAPVSLSLKTGIYTATLHDEGASHTLNFDSPDVLFAGVQVDSAGSSHSSRIFFGTPGDYTYYCAIPGHRVTMNGVVHVTGPTLTLTQAEAQGKPATATS